MENQKIKIPRAKILKKSKIEIIPMIDVMFFLLATMIMTSIALQKYNGVVVNLTSAKSESISNEQEDNVTISITHNNLIYVNKELVNLSKLSNYLENLQLNKENVIIASDSEAKHGVVAQAMIYAKKAGVKKFSIITKD
ncbi:MAG: ExbD/TolR family protein [Alphaproteobacteria bacterium]